MVWSAADPRRLGLCGSILCFYVVGSRVVVTAAAMPRRRRWGLPWLQLRVPSTAGPAALGAGAVSHSPGPRDGHGDDRRRGPGAIFRPPAAARVAASDFGEVSAHAWFICELCVSGSRRHDEHLFPLPLSPRLFLPLPEGAVLRWSLALFFFEVLCPCPGSFSKRNRFDADVFSVMFSAITATFSVEKQPV